jgi:hypothetical protein
MKGEWEGNIKTNLRKGLYKSPVLIIWLRVGTLARRSWLRHCATRRKVAGYIPYGVIGIFH